MKKLKTLASTLLLALSVSAFAKPQHIGANYDNSKSYVERNVRYHLVTKSNAKSYKETGLATWYCCYGPHARTADGSKFDPKRLTAAHKTLPFGTIVKVTNVKNGKTVRVEITDRGPFKKGKVIDLTPAAFAKIESKSMGIAQIKLEVVGFKY